MSSSSNSDMAMVPYYPRVPQELIAQIFYETIPSPVKTMADVECLLRLRESYFFLSDIKERHLPIRDLDIVFKVNNHVQGLQVTHSTTIESFTFADDVFKYRIGDVTFTSATNAHYSVCAMGAEMALLVKWVMEYTKPMLVDLYPGTSSNLIRRAMRCQIFEVTGITVTQNLSAHIREIP